MKIRLLETLPSSNPEFPFRPGQIIEVARPTAEMRRWLREGRAEPVKEESERPEVLERQEKATRD